MTIKFPGIAFFGHKRSGKSTLAYMVEMEILTQTGHGPIRLAFAEPIKHLCRDLLSPPFHTFEDSTLKKLPQVRLSPKASEILDDFLIRHDLHPLTANEKNELLLHTLEKPTTWRWLMQWVGTNVIRRRSPNFWVEKTRHAVDRAIAQRQFVIIEDGRMENELLCVKDLNFLTIGLACPANFNHDGHQTEQEALITSKKCDIFYSLPKGISVLQETAQEIITKFLNMSLRR